MVNLYSPPQVVSPYQSSLVELARGIEWSQGESSLILARCNSSSVRREMVWQLKTLCPGMVREVVLEGAIEMLYTALKTQLHRESPQAVTISGFESVTTLDSLLINTDVYRNDILQTFNCPIVWWVNDDTLRKIVRLAPHTYSMFTTVDFTVAAIA
ncbi:hypothetical protein IQ235_04220 [Oscillatoriales cyanobacterium LEGE 11467]|uniref:Uncharacterized protein n=1 Tax=Zarconia navalis LEGE 11467 TaxID=1828826 RepID=A0A928Z652_9CYAN|nr:hypothetical protein [Zarconia navalis]MBE9039997.1 hypothetical protein [Zarconia navalis LEGE 11467]